MAVPEDVRREHGARRHMLKARGVEKPPDSGVPTFQLESSYVFYI